MYCSATVMNALKFHFSKFEEKVRSVRGFLSTTVMKEGRGGARKREQGIEKEQCCDGYNLFYLNFYSLYFEPIPKSNHK